MTPTRNVDREVHLADILLKSQAALEEVRRYYKFDRHAHVFPEKMYFLLSHCAHLLFSLWLTEKESPSGIFTFNAHLDALASELDFEALRYVDYKRRTLHANAYEEHLKNEPNWFKFWLKALQGCEGGPPLDSDAFAQQVLTYVNNPEFLEGTVSRNDRKAFANLMKTDAGARLLHRSSLILEDMISAIVLQFASLDAGLHATEHIAALVCVLRQARLIIVNEIPAQGPYVLFSSKAWGEPTLLRVHPGQTLGRLRVVPKRDGGGIVCNFKWTAGSQIKKRSWTRATSALPHPYEEELLHTWPRDTSTPLNSSKPPCEAEPCWLVQRAEASRLKAIFRHIEAVQKSLSGNPRCAGLLGDIEDIFMDRHMGEEVLRLEWTYFDRLDQLLTKLQSAYREARILGGKNPGQEIIDAMWPVQRSGDGQARLSDVPTARSPRTPLQPRSVKWTQTVPVENHASQDQNTPPEQRTADTAVHAPAPQRASSGTTQAPVVPSVPDTPHNRRTADDTHQADIACAVAKPNDHNTPKPAGESLPPGHQEDRRPCADGRPDSEQGQEPQSEQGADEASSAVESWRDEDHSENVPTQCEVELSQEPQSEQGADEAPSALESWRDEDHSENVPTQCEVELSQEPQSEQDTEEAPSAVESHQDEDQNGNVPTQCEVELSQEPQSEQDADEAPSAVESWRDEDHNENVPTQCEVSGPPLNQDLSKSPQTKDQAVGETTEPKEEEPADSHSEPQVVKEPCHTYFQGLATKGTVTSAATPSLQTSGTRLVLPRPRPNTKADQIGAQRQLLTRLIEHHGSPTVSGDGLPLSRRKMEEELGWKPAEVQRTMTDIFGNRPFTVYKQKCSEGTIGDFLDAWAQDHSNGQVAVSPNLVAESV